VVVELEAVIKANLGGIQETMKPRKAFFVAIERKRADDVIDTDDSTGQGLKLEGHVE
jgi:hypothetical protein